MGDMHPLSIVSMDHLEFLESLESPEQREYEQIKFEQEEDLETLDKCKIVERIIGERERELKTLPRWAWYVR